MIWQGRDDAPLPGPRGAQWLRVAWRAPLLALLVFGCLALLLAVRLIEAPLFGAHRPVTPWITVFVCRNALRILGIERRRVGSPARGLLAFVANHSSWLDVFVLNAGTPLYFVSKAEVAGWPGIGWLARATGTVFIERRRGDAARQRALFEERIAAGHRLTFFPEGTSTDGRRVLPFKSTLFSAFFGTGDAFAIQPVALAYRAPAGMREDFYGWWGDMEFAPHMMMLLAAPRGGAVDVIYAEPVRISDVADRKALAARLERSVRSTLAAHGIEEAAERVGGIPV